MGNFKAITIQGGTVLVSPEDIELIEGYNWTVDRDGYAVCFNPHIKMHHLIAGKPSVGMVTDHINRVRLDNRRDNLRHVTHKESRANRGEQVHGEEHNTYYVQSELRRPSTYDRTKVNYARNRLGQIIGHIKDGQE